MKRLWIQLIESLVVALLLGGWMTSLSLADPFDDLNPGEWTEIPNSKLNDVLPSPVPPGNGPDNIIDAWNSAAYDTLRDRLLITGGGHNDYGGNEIYAFDIDTLRWSRIWGPSPDIPDVEGSCETTYSDGNPVARHTYDALEYLPQLDSFWLHGGSLYCGPGDSSSDTWIFDLATLAWSQKDDLPAQSELEMVTAYDPVTRHIFMSGPDSHLDLYEYSPESGTWAVPGSGNVNYRQTAALDYKKRIFVSIGTGDVIVFDLDRRTPTATRVSTTGPQVLVNSSYPGIDYDPVTERIVGWTKGSTVYSLDLDSMTWTAHSSSGTVTPRSAEGDRILNRWRYIPSRNAFITVNGIDQNVYIYKFSDGRPVDAIPPAAPADLEAP